MMVFIMRRIFVVAGTSSAILFGMILVLHRPATAFSFRTTSGSKVPSTNQLQLLSSSRHRSKEVFHVAAVSPKAAASVEGTTDAEDKGRRKQGRRRRRLPPGRPTLRFLSPFFDDTLQLLNPKTMASYQTKKSQQFDSPVFKTNIFFSPAVVVAGANSLKDVASQESDQTMEACFPPHHRKLFGEHSLLVISGKDHTRIRRLIQPSIASPGTVQAFADVIDRSVASFLLELENECRELYYSSTDDNGDHHVDGQDSAADSYIELVPRLRSYLVSLMLRLLLGPHYYDVDSSALAEDVSIWSQGLLSAPLTMIPWSTAAKAMRARARVVQVLQRCIDSERLHYNTSDRFSSSTRRNETYLLSRLVHIREEEDGSALSDEEIIDNIFTLIFAGSDTTASAITSLWMVLSRHPKLQEQLQDSQDTTKEQLVQSLLKSYPPAPFSMRRSKAPVQVDGYTIPANWLIVYGLAGAMKQQQPNDIDWDSWLFAQTQSSLLSSRATLQSNWVFGGGPRMCPGRFLAVLEISIVCKQLLSWTWEVDPHQNLEQRYTPGFFPVDGLRIRHFERR